ncbi:hypothetical protein Ct61P_07638 [Colletotrichum tofieldiae]|nr:hypothetical protein Ct61P_07638 [Colletotrichum tofieldiae]
MQVADDSKTGNPQRREDPQLSVVMEGLWQMGRKRKRRVWVGGWVDGWSVCAWAPKRQKTEVECESESGAESVMGQVGEVCGQKERSGPTRTPREKRPATTTAIGPGVSVWGIRTIWVVFLQRNDEVCDVVCTTVRGTTDGRLDDGLQGEQAVGILAHWCLVHRGDMDGLFQTDG